MALRMKFARKAKKRKGKGAGRFKRQVSLGFDDR